MSANLSSTCRRCGVIGLVGDAVETLAALDRMHDAEHPECNPLGAPAGVQRPGSETR